MPFEASQWIWCGRAASVNAYALFRQTFSAQAGPATLFAKGFIEEDIKEAYEKKVKKVGEQTQVPVEIPPEMLEGTPFEERSR